MVLSINSSLNNEKYLNCRRKSGNPIPFGNAQCPTINIDKSSDGKFSTSEATKNFIKGIVSPLTSMFSSPKNFLTGIGIAAGSMVLIAATGGAIAPILVTAGIGMGTFQAGKAIYQLASAKNGDDAEKAFYDFGGATSAIGLSAMGAKISLKQANIKTTGLNVIGSVKECILSSKKLAIQSFEVFKSGYFKTNIANTIKIAKQPQKLRKFSKELSAETEQKFQDSFNALKDTLPDEYKPFLKGRSKSEISIYEKMVKDIRTIDQQIKQIQASTKISNAAKSEALKELHIERKKISTQSATAKSKVGDGYGTRLILDDVSPKNIEKLINHFIDSVKRGDIEITEIENYNGANPKLANKNTPYFSTEQIKELQKISSHATLKEKPKTSGYTAVQLKIRPKNREIMELQIRGKYIDEVANWEHLPYDLRQGKDIAKGNNKSGILTAGIKKAIEKLTETEYNLYQKYVYDNYMYARAKETNVVMTEPKFPKDLNPILKAENLQIIYDKISKLKPSPVRNPYEIKPQLGILASTESLNQC